MIVCDKCKTQTRKKDGDYMYIDFLEIELCENCYSYMKQMILAWISETQRSSST